MNILKFKEALKRQMLMEEEEEMEEAGEEDGDEDLDWGIDWIRNDKA